LEADGLRRYVPWLYAAAIYNLAWGALNVVYPRRLFRMLRMQPPEQLPLWQVVGMLVAVYAPAYWWAARHPRRHPHLVAVGLLGKVLGPIGFAWSVKGARLPWRFGWVIATNDLFWWPALGAYVVRSAEQAGGWRSFFSGSTPESASDSLDG
jgi:hypothetical protein